MDNEAEVDDQSDLSAALGLTKKVMLGVIQRVSQRLERGEHLPHVSLPQDKAAFPKMLSLDQNHWIYLSQANLGLNGQQDRLGGALAAIRAATATGRLLVPVLGTNALEVGEHRDAGRRERLAKFMVDVSGNLSALNHIITRSFELRSAMSRHYCGAVTETPIRSNLVQRAMYAAVSGRTPSGNTGDSTMDRLLTESLFEPEVSAAALAHVASREMIATFRERDIEGARFVEGVRAIDADLTTQRRRLLELRNVLSGGSLAKRLEPIQLDLGIDPAQFKSWLDTDENLLRLIDDVPSLDVTATLMLERDRNRDHRTHRNDGKDFSFLDVAIPYANIVVAERSWASIARSSGLADKYGTAVSADAAELPELLQRAGCI